MTSSIGPDGDSTGGGAGRWFLLGAALTTVLVVVAAQPLLENPQLEADDYRYLSQLQSGGSSCVIENSWDHMWWVEQRSTLRFFRPVVIASYAIEGTSASPRVRASVNIALHLLATWLVLALMFRLHRPGIAAVATSVMFAGLASHAEPVNFIVGRNAMLVAIGVLFGLLLHIEGSTRQRPWLRYLALGPYLLALGSKETGVALPILCVLADRFLVAPGKTPWKLYGTYAALTLGYLALRQFHVGALDAGATKPYVIPPWDADFPAHLLTKAIVDAQDLALGVASSPFMDLDGVAINVPAILVFLGIASGATWWLRHDRRFRFVVAATAITWALTTPTYVSQRYLYLPSVGWVLCLGLCLARSTGRLRTVALVIAIAFAGVHAIGLRDHIQKHAHTRVGTSVAALVRRAAPDLQGHQRLIFVDFPGDWVTCQFLEHLCRVELGNPEIEVLALSCMSMTSPPKLDVTSDDTLVVTTEAPLLDTRWSLLPWIRFENGVRVERTELGFSVEVLRGDGLRCWSLRLRLEASLSDCALVSFIPPARRMKYLDWLRLGELRVTTPR